MPLYKHLPSFYHNIKFSFSRPSVWCQLTCLPKKSHRYKKSSSCKKTTMQAFCNLESKSLQAPRTPDFKSRLELPKAFLFNTLFSFLPFSSFSLFWHHLQNMSVTKTPRCFSYSAHSVSTKTSQGFMEKRLHLFLSIQTQNSFPPPSIF